jgi:hypothetical protein
MGVLFLVVGLVLALDLLIAAADQEWEVELGR